MNELYELKDMLMRELKEYGKKGEVSPGALEIVDKLTHTLKNLCKIIDDMDGASYDRMWNIREGSYDDRSYGDRSYARKRNSMGRYSRHGDVDGMIADLHDLMSDAKDEETRKEFRHFIKTLEQM